ncbi:hypothetical protein C9374_010831 [Naegleria lovaniensis]|uniref:Anaphase-promoting complex subunit 4-like WD40 domain-containing protein n=1 Tax=Naegleria lovaniensis TaxID=51637 RepID=A0AA88GD20_NAELO|nr:uncharacterized protein C9374_010831 [Naegleria lovaniensis]KAG2374261.1 hypothetical protein C9374_010831 [Naegleria lovaniensis]
MKPSRSLNTSSSSGLSSLASSTDSLETPSSSTSSKHAHHNLSSISENVGLSYTVSKNKFLTNDSEVFCLKFNPDSKYLAAGCSDGLVRVFSVSDGKNLYSLNTAQKQQLSLPVTSIKFKPHYGYGSSQNILLVSGSKGVVQHWHVTSEKLLNEIVEEDNQVYVVDYRKDGSYFATAGKDSTVRLYDEETNVCVTQMRGGNGVTTAGHTNRIFSLKFHPNDDNILITGGWDNTVQIWDKRMDYAARRIFGPHICGDAIDVDVNDNLLTGSWRSEEQLQLWDFGSGKLIENVNIPHSGGQHTLNAYCAQFGDSSGSLIGVGGSGTNEALILARGSGKVVGAIRELERAVFCMSFSSSQNHCAVGTGSGSIFLLHK